MKNGNPEVESSPPFNCIAIVGLGLIGGSIGYGIRRAWPGVRVVGVDAPDIGATACRRGAVGEARASIDQLAECDAIVLAVPIPEITALVGRLASVGQAIVTDVGSTKREIMRAAGRRLTFIGGHPIAGSARGGLDHAHAGLFEGRPWLLVPGAAADSTVQQVERLVSGLGAIPRRTDADTHDRVMAYVSHLPQVLANTLMSTAGTAVGLDGLGISGPGFADMTRLASSPAEIWRGILSTNADYIEEALHVFLERLPSGADELGDRSRIDAAFGHANDWFRVLASAKAAGPGDGGETV